MNIDQAMAIVAQVCANHMGTLKDHQTIQQALQVITDKLNSSTSQVDAATAQDTNRDGRTG